MISETDLEYLKELVKRAEHPNEDFGYDEMCFVLSENSLLRLVEIVKEESKEIKNDI